MALKYNDQSIPFIDLGDGYQICFQEDRCFHGEEMESKARLAINETPDNVKSAMEEFRRLIACDPGLCVPSDDSWYMNMYLRVGQYDPKDAFNILQASSLQKLKNAEYFGTIASVRHVFDEGLVWMLPERDEDGSVIVVIESGKKWNTSTVSLTQLNTAVCSVIAVLTRSQEAQLHGCKLLFDADSMSMSHIVQFTPKSTGIMLHLMEKCSVIRVLNTQTINTGVVYNVLFAIMKPMLTKKMREKTFIHGRNMAGLHKHISSKILPPRFGGTSKAPGYEGRVFGDLMLHYNEWLQNLHQHGYKQTNS